MVVGMYVYTVMAGARPLLLNYLRQFACVMYDIWKAGGRVLISFVYPAHVFVPL